MLFPPETVRVLTLAHDLAIVWGVIGIGLALVAIRGAERPTTPAFRVQIGVLLIALVVGTLGATLHAQTVVYNICHDPTYPAWLWWLTCAL